MGVGARTQRAWGPSTLWVPETRSSLQCCREDVVLGLGPMAQDFAAAFGLGDTDRQIFLLDATGVCMAAIQALHERVVTLETELADLKGTPTVS